jgi:pyrroline-5-carboxylate reductase
MACAIIGGILGKQVVTTAEVHASDPSESTRVRVAEKFGIATFASNAEVAAWADIVVLAVKPYMMEAAIDDIVDVISPDTTVVSIAAGKTLEWIDQAFGMEMKLVRVMPNTPALVGEGATGICANKLVTEEELQTVIAMFKSIGIVEQLSEPMIDVIGAVAGSTPAYVAMFIEALADAAVAEGMPRAQAYQIAAQAVMGSGKLVLESGMHPGQLKDMVCSPAGTTIEGVQILESCGMRAAVMEAIRAAIAKTRRL